MDKQEHGQRLKAAMASRGLGRERIAGLLDVATRTVTNWTSGKTMPSDAERVKLRETLGPYDSPGDPVEVALSQSELIDWRRDEVRATYRRNLHEQRSMGQTREA